MAAQIGSMQGDPDRLGRITSKYRFCKTTECLWWAEKPNNKCAKCLTKKCQKEWFANTSISPTPYVGDDTTSDNDDDDNNDGDKKNIAEDSPPPKNKPRRQQPLTKTAVKTMTTCLAI